MFRVIKKDPSNIYDESLWMFFDEDGSWKPFTPTSPKIKQRRTANVRYESAVLSPDAGDKKYITLRVVDVTEDPISKWTLVKRKGKLAIVSPNEIDDVMVIVDDSKNVEEKVSETET